MPSVSILVPVLNEARSLAPVLDDIAAECASLGDYEVIVADDGSTDETPSLLARLRSSHPRLRIVRHPRPAGQSAALHSAALAARAPILCTMDGDGQNPAREIPRLCHSLTADRSGRIGLVAGQRTSRRATLSKRLSSRIANAVRRRALKDGARDTGCGLKAFRREAFLAMPYFDHMHRFYPALIRRDGWEVRLVEVADRPRLAGRSKYTNLGRAVSGAIDLVGVAWLIHRRKSAAAVEVETADPAARPRTVEVASAGEEVPQVRPEIKALR